MLKSIFAPLQNESKNRRIILKVASIRKKFFIATLVKIFLIIKWVNMG